MTVTAAEARHMILWYARLHPRSRPPGPDNPAVWHAELQRLIDEGLVQLTAEASPRLMATPHPRAAKWTGEAAAAITTGMRAVLLTLEERSEVPWRGWGKVGAEYGIERDHVYEAARWLIEDGLIVNRGPEEARVTAPALAMRPRRQPVAPEDVGLQRPAPAPATAPPPPAPPPAPQPAPQPAPAPAPKPEPEPQPAAQAPSPPPAPAPAAPQPEPEPEPELSRPPSRPPKPKPAPVPATLTTELLSRIAVAAEVQAQLTIAGARRVRTPLGVSPLLDCQRRIAVVLAAADGPLTAGQIGTGHLTPGQRRYRDAALADGCGLGAFAASGGALGRGVRYTLRDPEPLGSSWDEVHAAADVVRRRREAG